MTNSALKNDPKAAEAADKDKVNAPANDGSSKSDKDFGDGYKPLDPASHETDPALKKEDQKTYGVDNSASLRTSDSDDDVVKYWTVQSVDDDDNPVALAEVLGEPGQKFFYEELPYADSVEQWGVDSKTWPLGLPLHSDAAEKVEADVEKDDEDKPKFTAADKSTSTYEVKDSKASDKK